MPGIRLPAPITIALPLSAAQEAGTFIIQSNPADELIEIWTYVRRILVILGISFAATLCLVYLFLSVALKPLTTLSHAFRSVENGRYEPCLTATGAAEISQVLVSYNSMLQRLREATEEKRALANRLVSAQEEERRALANDLHDDLGPSLFALSVDAGAIRDINEQRGAGEESHAGRIRSSKTSGACSGSSARFWSACDRRTWSTSA